MSVRLLDLGLLMGALVLSSCTDGDVLKEKVATQLLETEVRDIPIYVTVPTSRYAVPEGYEKLYEDQFPIIRTVPLRLGDRRRLTGLNMTEIDKNGWKEHLDMAGEDIAIVNYYVSFKGITSIASEPGQIGCNAIAYYEVAISKETPWTSEYLKTFGVQHNAGEIESYSACFEKRNTGWTLKNAIWEQ